MIFLIAHKVPIGIPIVIAIIIEEKARIIVFGNASHIFSDTSLSSI